MSYWTWQRKLKNDATHMYLSQKINGIQRIEGSPSLKTLRSYINSKDFENLFNKTQEKGRINITIKVKI